jgi:hypothetical protein
LAQTAVLARRGSLTQYRTVHDWRNPAPVPYSVHLAFGSGADELVRIQVSGVPGDSGLWQSVTLPRYSTNPAVPVRLPFSAQNPGHYDERVNFSADGSVGVVFRTTARPPNGSQRSYLIYRNGTLAEAPVGPMHRQFPEHNCLSQDGRYLFGTEPEGRDVRVDLWGLEEPVPIPGLRFGDQLVAVSKDGRTAVFAWRSDLRQTPVWIEGQGLLTTAVPANFIVRGLSGDGMTLVGKTAGAGGSVGHPAAVHRMGSTWRLHEYPGSGTLWDASEDGSVLVGDSEGENGIHHSVFRPYGGSYPIDVLLPGVTLPAASERLELSAQSVSRDGRRILLHYRPFTDGDLDSTVWVADIVFPWDPTSLAAETTGNARVRVRIPTQRRLSYQLKRAHSPSAPPGDWVAVGPPRSGDGQEAVHEEDASGTAAFYAVDVKPE